MSDRRMLDAAVTQSRREFLSSMVTTASGLIVASGVVACGGGGGGTPVTPQLKGEISGLVSDLQGVPQPGLGSLILMYNDGRHTGDRVGPDANGRFRFANIDPGNYQIRFHAPGLAIVPEPFPHPVRCTVDAGKTTDVPIRIKLGNYNSNLVEIYAGDDFYQLQPDGQEDGETVVKLGTLVCWYNVGTSVHTVTGGPWVDSGDLQKSQAYIWTASETGLFAFSCKYHQPGQRATLRVTA
ncbi:MAG: carboxypeptidase regulatory-like domain-containing protein [Gemmatimonadaceae bacterium]